MLRTFIATMLTLILGAIPLAAEQTGRGSRTDQRIRTLTFNPDDVYKIDAYTGYAVTVLVEPGEMIMDEFRGDTKSWDFTPTSSRDGFIFKPIFVPPQETNLIVRSDRRTYVFLLQGHKGGAPDKVGFLYRFAYPNTGKGLKILPATTIQAAFNRSGRMQNLQYSAAGDKLLRPEVAFDDGRKTYLRLGHQTVRPSVFAMEADGRERLVNTSDLADGTIVVAGVYPRLVLRDGPYVVCVFNTPLYELSRDRNPGEPKGRTDFGTAGTTAPSGEYR